MNPLLSLLGATPSTGAPALRSDAADAAMTGEFGPLLALLQAPVAQPDGSATLAERVVDAAADPAADPVASAADGIASGTPLPSPAPERQTLAAALPLGVPSPPTPAVAAADRRPSGGQDNVAGAGALPEPAGMSRSPLPGKAVVAAESDACRVAATVSVRVDPVAADTAARGGVANPGTAATQPNAVERASSAQQQTPAPADAQSDRHPATARPEQAATTVALRSVSAAALDRGTTGSPPQAPVPDPTSRGAAPDRTVAVGAELSDASFARDLRASLRPNGLDLRTHGTPSAPLEAKIVDPASRPVAPPLGPPEPAVVSRRQPTREPAMEAPEGRVRSAGSTPPGIAGELPDVARVRQAAQLLRQWQARGAAGEPGADSPVTLRISHGPAQPAPAVGLASVAAAMPATPTLSLTDAQGSAEQLVQQLLQGQARNLSSVRLQLAPAELGELNIHLRHQGDRLDVVFTASHAGAREAIEASLPHLRALLQDVGVQLADVDVRQGPREGAGGASQQQGGNPQSNPETPSRRLPNGTATTPTDAAEPPRLPPRQGLIDAIV